MAGRSASGRPIRHDAYPHRATSPVTLRSTGEEISRRAVLTSASALALSACGPRDAQSQSVPADLPPLKTVAPFRVGACVQALHLDDPALSALLGHTLVWYAQSPPAFERLDESRIGFADAYRNYIHAVAGRYRGQAVGWDVVNEAVAEDGAGWRDSLWAQRLGAFDHIALAYRTAREADPQATLLLNDYNLEYMPKKRATFLKLAERLLASGAPLTGLGTQMHVAADIAPGKITTMIRELASLGLPIHVSELDVSLTRADNKLLSRGELQRRQTAVYAEAAEAFMALPPRQRFAFTLWGLRDRDSWLKKENASDAPAPFDDAGRPKAGAAALVEAFRA